MSAEIVNLRRARKAKMRDEKEQRAEENRRRFGQTKADRLAGAKEAERAASAHEGNRRVPATRAVPPAESES